MSKLSIDTLGADLGVGVVVEGVMRARLDYPDTEMILVGPEGELRDSLKQNAEKFTAKEMGIIQPGILIEHAPDVILPSESPTLAFRRKKESSIVVGLKLVKEGRAHGFVSAGSTGALLTGATVIIGRRSGISRPALATLLPNAKKGFTLLIDSGANMDSKPAYYVQFAELGVEYMSKVMGIKSPRVGLVNVGAEDEKGNEAVKEAFGLLKTAGLNFVGNIEGREIPGGEVDVVVCDGFTGNVILKFMEGVAKTMTGMIREEMTATTMSKIGALLARGAFKRIKKRFDYREVGGAPFLGLNHLVVKAHGSSDAVAIKNAVRQCVTFAK